VPAASTNAASFTLQETVENAPIMASAALSKDASPTLLFHIEDCIRSGGKARTINWCLAGHASLGVDLGAAMAGTPQGRRHRARQLEHYRQSTSNAIAHVSSMLLRHDRFRTRPPNTEISCGAQSMAPAPSAASRGRPA
jgi:hypothetical protein